MFSKGVLVGALLLSNAQAFAREVTGLFYSEFAAYGELRFKGNNPKITPELMKYLHGLAEINARKVCDQLLPQPNKFYRTKSGELSQSILRYEVTDVFLCGKEISDTKEVVPSMVQALKVEKGE